MTNKGGLLMTENEMIQIQMEMQDKISLVDILPNDEIRTVTGIDLAYTNDQEKEYAVCYAVTLDRKSHQVIDSAQDFGVVEVPYISGLLAFREKDLILKTYEKLKQKGDILIFDGNGILHERKMGIATHVGILLDKPTIGVAKTYYHMHNLDLSIIGNKKFDTADITNDGFVYGKILRSRVDCKPVFISCGTNITLNTAIILIKEFVTDDSRIPLPTRLADIGTHKVRKDLLKNLNISYILDVPKINEREENCEWKAVNSLWKSFYQTKCGYNARHGQKELGLCPWCRKRIRIKN